MEVRPNVLHGHARANRTVLFRHEPLRWVLWRVVFHIYADQKKRRNNRRLAA